jgi:hypothetical protein
LAVAVLVDIIQHLLVAVVVHLLILTQLQLEFHTQLQLAVVVDGVQLMMVMVDIIMLQILAPLHNFIH